MCNMIVILKYTCSKRLQTCLLVLSPAPYVHVEKTTTFSLYNKFLYMLHMYRNVTSLMTSSQPSTKKGCQKKGIFLYYDTMSSRTSIEFAVFTLVWHFTATLSSLTSPIFTHFQTVSNSQES